MAKHREVHFRDIQKIRHYRRNLKAVDDAVVYDGLIRVFRETGLNQTGFNRQEIAGTLLALRRPNPQEELQDIISNCIDYWDVSIEQFPWYLCLVFGREKFISVVHEMMSHMDPKSMTHKHLDTFLYWTRMSDDRIIEKLKDSISNT